MKEKKNESKSLFFFLKTVERKERKKKGKMAEQKRKSEGKREKWI